MRPNIEPPVAGVLSTLERLDQSSHVIGMPDGDRVAIQVKGRLDGMPVMYVHGMPGSRIIPLYKEVIPFVDNNICLVSHDERGYGDSSRKQHRRVVDTAHDIAAIADRLNLDRFSIIGHSGGGPGALAAATVLGKRVSRVALLSSFAPPEYAGWFDGMHPDNTQNFTNATHNRGALRQVLQARGSLPAEKFVLGNARRFASQHPDIQAMTTSHQLAVKNGIDGWMDHVIAIRTPWGVDTSPLDIPVKIIHGTHDVVIPVGHANWLGRQVQVQPDLIEGAGHTLPHHAWTQIFRWVIGKTEAVQTA